MILESEEYLKTLHSAATKASALLLQEAPNNFAAFCRSVLKDEQTQQRIVPQPIHMQWFRHIERCKSSGDYCGILSIPEAGKSSVLAIGLPLFEMGRHPTIRGAVICSEEGMSKKRVKPAKDYVQRDPDYRTIFPDALPDRPEKWTELEFSVRRPGGIKDPSYRGYGIGTPPRGARIDLAIFDDVCTIKNTIMEPAMRPKIIAAYYEGYTDRFNPKTFVAYIGGIVHNKDLSSRLLNDPKFHFIIQRVSDDYTHIIQEDARTGVEINLPLWEHSWTAEFLKAKHDSDERSYARAYKHQGYDDSERTFDKTAIMSAIRYVDDPCEVPTGAFAVLGFDLSEKRRPGSVIVPVSQQGEKRRVHPPEFGKWSGTDKASKLAEFVKKYKTLAEIVENNALQQSIIDLMIVVIQQGEDKVPLNIQPFTTGKQKADEVLGLPGVAAEFKKGRWEILFPRDHYYREGCDCGPCLLVTQLLEHPFGHTDGVMSLWFARHGLVSFASTADMEWSDGAGGRNKVGIRSERQSRLQRFKKDRKGRR